MRSRLFRVYWKRYLHTGQISIPLAPLTELEMGPIVVGMWWKKKHETPASQTVWPCVSIISSTTFGYFEGRQKSICIPQLISPNNLRQQY